MIGNTHSSDKIALDFLDIVKKIAPQKESVAQSADQPSKDSALTKEAQEELLENYSEPNPEDFIVSEADDEDLGTQASRVLESKIEDLQNEIDDDTGADDGADADGEPVLAANKAVDAGNNAGALKILNGLGKIAGGLRNKGESFAADVVEATAMSIKGDLVAEASKRSQVVSELQKISFDLKTENKGFASDLVEATINKILKS